MKRRLTLLLVLAPLIAWGLFGVFGGRLSSRISARFGPRILARGDGKFTSAEAFVERRLRDGAVLMTAGCLLALAQLAAAAAASRWLRGSACWVAQACCGFVSLNVFAAIAGQTVLFWCLLFTGKDHTHNYTQYRLKQGLMKETGVPSQAVLLGSSQTRAEIDARSLNKRLGGKIWTTELHFPGSMPYDMVLCLERVPPVHVDYAITYLSEGCFYVGGADERLMFFFGFRDLPNYVNLGDGKPPFDRNLACGLLGDLIPVFRFREPLADRALGWKFQQLNGQEYIESLDPNLVARAKASATGFHMGSECRFNKSAFIEFSKQCRQRRCRLIVCCGQLNPILERALDPAMRPDLLAFLRAQAARDPNILLLEDSQLPRQTEEDYDDLTHVNQAARERFTQYLASVMEGLLRQKSLAIQAHRDVVVPEGRPGPQTAR